MGIKRLDQVIHTILIFQTGEVSEYARKCFILKRDINQFSGGSNAGWSGSIMVLVILGAKVELSFTNL